MVLVIRGTFVICWNFFSRPKTLPPETCSSGCRSILLRNLHIFTFFFRWSVFRNNLKYNFFFYGRNFNVVLFLTEKTRWARFPFLSVNKIAASLLRRESFPVDSPKSFIKIFTSCPRLLSKVKCLRKFSTCEWNWDFFFTFN